MTTKVYIDGVISGPEQAKVSVFDRGFLYGDSVYEVMRTAGGAPVDLTPHLERLKRSADSIAMKTPADKSIRKALEKTMAATGEDENYVRIVVTRGVGEIGLDTDLSVETSLIILAKPLVLPPAELYEQGATLAIVDVEVLPKESIDPSIKSGNYLSNIMALHQARKSGAHEALRLNRQGLVAEGASSNVFVLSDGKIWTPHPKSGLLPGITRMRVMALASDLGVPVQETSMAPQFVLGADEMFITSSVRGVMPVTHVNEYSIGDGSPGPVTKRIMDAYGGFLEQVARKA